MLKQLFLPLAAVAIFVILVGVFIKNPTKFGLQITPVISTQSSLKEIKVGEHVVKVTLADTAEKRTKGLSGTASLNEDQGILFVFDKENTTPSFWMKDMLIGIDIIWINDGKIIQIDKNIPAPDKGTLDSSLKKYKPSSGVDYVLEVNLGYSDKNNIKVGDSVSI